MVIDTSAIIAILCDEPERRAFNEAIEDAERRLISAATFVEASIIVESRFGAEGIRDLDLWLAKAEVELVSVDAHHADIARRAYRNFGKGRHRAALNYGDCFTYALAKSVAEPILCKGNDFVQTDIDIVSV